LDKFKMAKKVHLLENSRDPAKKIVLPPGADITAYDTTWQKEIVYELNEESKLTYIFISTVPMKKKVTFILNGRSALVNVYGIYLLNKDQSVSLITRQEHYAPGASSTVTLRGVLADGAQIDHKGVIFVDHSAERTNASHYNKTILLSRKVQVNSKPELEVRQKNVQCSHGSAVGYVDKDQFFYVQSRGISEPMARSMLLKAFLTFSCDAMRDKTLKEDLMKQLNEKMREMV